MERGGTFWRSKIYRILPKLSEKHPTWRWILITLGVKDCLVSELRETLTLAGESFQRLTQLKEFPSSTWFRFTEITKGRGETAQIRFHCILLVRSGYFGKNFINKARWIQMWRRSLRVDYNPIVTVKTIKDKWQIPELLEHWLDRSDLTDDPNWLTECNQQLRHFKQISAGGLVKKYLHELNEPKNAINDGIATFLDRCLRSQATASDRTTRESDRM